MNEPGQTSYHVEVNGIGLGEADTLHDAMVTMAGKLGNKRRWSHHPRWQHRAYR